MPNTPKGITYPSSSSPVAVPADIQELATDVDGLLVPNTGGTYTGSVSFTQSPSVPTPTSGLHAVNKTYADLINTDVTALETELGSNPSGTFSTVADRLNTQDHPASTTDNTVARYDGTQGKLQASTVVIDDNGRLTTATGATGGYGFVGGAVRLTGTGSPESVVSAPPGSTFLQTDSVVDVKGWIKWIKATGTGNTGWVVGPEADTGWRDVSASFTGGYTSGVAYIRRVGNVVQVRASSGLTPTLTNGAWNTVINLPLGFRSAVNVDPVAWNAGFASDMRRAFISTAGEVRLMGAGATEAATTLYATFTTAEAWPSSLPGTAA